MISALVAAPLQRRLGTVITCVTGLSCIAAGFLGIGAAVALSGGGALSGALLAAFCVSVLLYQIGVPLFAPTVPTMLLQCVPSRRRGAVMGLDVCVNTVARAAAPPLLGAIYAWKGASAAFATAGAVALFAAAVAAIRRLIVLRVSGIVDARA